MLDFFLLRMRVGEVYNTCIQDCSRMYVPIVWLHQNKVPTALEHCM